ncbi:AsmA family protein [Brucella oryzae]|uniref:AsmA family protein n=1 Tax=Brucella oryzae TaxID=335286 RepID=A0A2S7IV69_9HYPH|nr:AsmA family protein [Brucella oryzae]PQA71848.1 AsmA family protein [Brucella oryzae]
MRWPRFTRLIIALVILCAAAAATLLAVVPFIVSTDAIRVRVAQEISAWTGYSVELRQAPRLKVFPVLRASLNGVTLSKLTDQGQKPLMSADRIDVELSPLDAIMGHISFSETQIVRPHVNLDGPVSNFSQLLDAIASSNGRLGTAIRAQRALQQSGSGDNAQAAQQASQPFGRVVVRDGTIAFNRPGSEPEITSDEQITNVNATLEWPRTSSAATLKGSAKWRDETSQFSLTAAQALPLLAGGTSDVTASLTANPLSLTFQGKANISKDRFFEGDLTAKTPSLSGAVRWLSLPPIAGSAEIGAFSVDSTITATPKRLKFADVEMTASDSPAKGVIEIGLEQEQPAVTGTLAFDKLDLRRLFSAFIPLPDGGARSPNERNNSDRDVVDTSFIDRAEVDLRLSAQNATAGPVSMTGVAAAVQIRGGRAIFDIGDAKAFNGILQANVQIVRDLKSASGELRFNASDIDSSQFFTALGFDKPFVSGKGNVSLFMKGPANRWSGLLTNAQGNVSIQLNNGQMQGFAVQDFLAKAQTQRFFALERKDNIALAFNRLDVKANLSDGVATLENAKLDTSDGTLTLAGIVPFVDRSLALSGEVVFPNSQPQQQQEGSTDGQDNQQPAENPPAKPPLNFFVGGSWDRPFISPSSTGMGQ